MLVTVLKLFVRVDSIHKRILRLLIPAVIAGALVVLAVLPIPQQTEKHDSETVQTAVSSETGETHEKVSLSSPAPESKVETEAEAAEPEEEAEGISEIPVDDWNLILVNRDHPLDDSYTVPELTSFGGGHSVDSRIVEALNTMLEAARKDGCNPVICSSYRTIETQTCLFRQKTQTYLDQDFSQSLAENLASRWVARPGVSEHHTGLAVDIVDYSYQNLDEKQEDTPTQKWLLAHSAEYGFILRYPTDKDRLTGIHYEPWHYRYVGVEHAKAITEQGLCLEEYLALAEPS